MLCSQCAASLPDGSQFCIKCGQPLYSLPMLTTTMPEETAVLGCTNCGAELPDGAQFCLQCGKPVALPSKEPKTKTVTDFPDTIDASALQPARPKLNISRIVLWSLVAMLLIGIAWAATSDNPFAQGFQELVGWKHDHTVLDEPFSVGPHTFRYYKFALPEGSMNVSIIGQFTASSDAGKNAKNVRDSDKNKSAESDNNIEVYVLSEPAFTVWQNGYATNSVYESGRVAEGTMQADLPAGAGIYYLVFNNKFSPKTAKSINASASLRYKSWLPDWFRRMKNSVLGWFGL